MVTSAELLVELKIPDPTAITAFHTLQRLGYKNLKKIKRIDYYKFNIEGDFKKFIKEIVKIDVLVNANKHRYYVQKNFPDLRVSSLRTRSRGGKIFFDDAVFILVKNDYKDTGLLSVLQKRLGFKEIKSMEKGILWVLYFDLKDKTKAKKLAEEIAKGLLVNENYQGFEVI